MKMPLPYLSCSAYRLYKENPLEFYQQYYVARLDEPTDKMILGKIFQEAWSDPKYPYVQELRKHGFTSNYVRIIQTALTHHQTYRLPKAETERKYKVKGGKLIYPILAVFDGHPKGQKLIVENKFGVVWTQQRCDEDVQLKWYSLVCRLKFGYIPKVLLQSFNSKTGIPTHYYVKHTAAELDELIKEINSVVRRIQAGDFETR